MVCQMVIRGVSMLDVAHNFFESIAFPFRFGTGDIVMPSDEDEQTVDESYALGLVPRARREAANGRMKFCAQPSGYLHTV
jgi:hypothetical protein